MNSFLTNLFVKILPKKVFFSQKNFFFNIHRKSSVKTVFTETKSIAKMGHVCIFRTKSVRTKFSSRLSGFAGGGVKRLSMSSWHCFTPPTWDRNRVIRIFAQRAIVYFGQFSKDYWRSKKSWATFFLSIDYEIVLKKNCLGYVLGDFFTNSSGHPGQKWKMLRRLKNKWMRWPQGPFFSAPCRNLRRRKCAGVWSIGKCLRFLFRNCSQTGQRLLGRFVQWFFLHFTHMS
jgi:hypothetical protein